jgi:hypothetical protein
MSENRNYGSIGGELHAAMMSQNTEQNAKDLWRKIFSSSFSPLSCLLPLSHRLGHASVDHAATSSVRSLIMMC